MDQTIYVGIDWARAKHQGCVVSETGKPLFEGAFDHCAEGISAWADRLLAMVDGDGSRIKVAIETPHHAVAEMFMERGMRVFSINPKQLDRFRDRYGVAGAKDDRRDAFTLADSLRTDGDRYRPVEFQEAHIVVLRELTRMHVALGQELVSLSNRILELLVRYFPQAANLGSPHSDRWLIKLLEQFPSPEDAARATLEDMNALRCRRDRQKLLDALQAPALRTAPGVNESSKRHLLSLIARWQLTDAEKSKVVLEIDRLLKAFRPQNENEHSTVAIIQSLPGAGTIITATMLSEANQLLQQRDYSTLRCKSGVAPVTRQSGKKKLVLMRYAYSHPLGNALFYLAKGASRLDPDLRKRYQTFRARGIAHAAALRRIADHLLSVLCALLKKNSLFLPSAA